MKSRRQQTHLQLYAAAEWIRTSGNESERVEIEAQIHDVEYYIEDLEDQLDDLKKFNLGKRSHCATALTTMPMTFQSRPTT